MTRVLFSTISVSLLLCALFSLPPAGWTMSLWSGSEQWSFDDQLCASVSPTETEHESPDDPQDDGEMLPPRWRTSTSATVHAQTLILLPRGICHSCVVHPPTRYS